MKLYQLFVLLAPFLTLVMGVINITTHPSDQEAIVGGSVSLSCEASGGQFEQWLHSDQPVSSGGDYHITSTATGSTLEITSFRKELKGEYRCQFVSDDCIIVTHPGEVKCFGDIVFSKHPEDFQSYRLNDPTSVTINIVDSVKEREIIAFECAVDDSDPYIVDPIITWQRCESDGTFTDITDASTTFPPGDVRAFFPLYVFFQSGLTGYYQLLDGENPAHAGTRYRCKAASSISGDTADPVYSNCATVVWNNANVPVPPDFPEFRTIPLMEVPLLQGERGYMACTLQNNPDNRRLLIRENGRTIIITFLYIGSVAGVQLIGQSNVEFDTSQSDASFTNATFECHLAGTNFSHFTTFRLIKPFEALAEEICILAGKEGESIILSVDLPSPPSKLYLYNNGAPMDIDGTNVQYGIAGNTHSILISSLDDVQKRVFQIEAVNKAGRITKYFYVTVLIKASTTTIGGDIRGQISSPLSLTCDVRANANETSVTVTWRKDGVDVDQQSVALTNGVGNSTYTIPTLDQDDAGSYECIFKNSLGTGTTATFDVLVQKFDAPVITSAVVDENNATFVNVTFMPSDGGDPDSHVVEVMYTDENGQQVTTVVQVGAAERSALVPVPDSASGIQVRVKSVKNGKDLTEYSPWHVIPDGDDPHGYYDRWWVIFLTVLFSVIGGCALFCCFFLCFCLLCFPFVAGKRDEEDEEEDKRAKTPTSDTSV